MPPFLPGADQHAFILARLAAYREKNVSEATRLQVGWGGSRSALASPLESSLLNLGTHMAVHACMKR